MNTAEVVFLGCLNLHLPWGNFFKWINFLSEKLYSESVFIGPHNLALTFNMAIQIWKCDRDDGSNR